ncbi:hypothetical protein NDU88_004647 [Pleurodeles waltl]|uniref:Uncharacterized protein n=1 Tax=Pleurodeles waltl TaxID=8319 RepID=A0AAV7TSI9_PLEWA|nr:hypothetical protein NDU88_004647 [Pleurodeles waltl]
MRLRPCANLGTAAEGAKRLRCARDPRWPELERRKGGCREGLPGALSDGGGMPGVHGARRRHRGRMRLC